MEKGSEWWNAGIMLSLTSQSVLHFYEYNNGCSTFTDTEWRSQETHSGRLSLCTMGMNAAGLSMVGEAN